MRKFLTAFLIFAALGAAVLLEPKSVTISPKPGDEIAVRPPPSQLPPPLSLNGIPSGANIIGTIGLATTLSTTTMIRNPGR